MEFHRSQTVGLFEAIHVTYKEHIRCIADAGDESEAGFHEDLLVHDGN